MIGILGFILSIAVLIYLSYKRWNIIPVSIVAAVIVGLSSSIDIWSIFNDYYMPSFASFIMNWFLIFTLGAIFSEMLTRSGSVASIAYKLLDIFGEKNAVLVIALITALLTIGGVNPFVQIFLVWPICLVFSRSANIPRGIWIATFYLGMFAAYSFPGNPGMANVVVSQNLDVSSASMAVFSLLLFLFNFTVGYMYLKHKVKTWQKKGIGYVETTKDKEVKSFEREACPKFVFSILPMAVCVVLYSILTSKNMPLIGGMASGNAVLLAMFVSTILCILLNLKTLLPQLKEALMKGSLGGINPTITAAVVTGYLGVFLGSETYTALVNAILSLSAGPFFQAFIACNVLTFITGSGTVAAVPVFNAFKPTWISMETNFAALRPVMVCSCAGFAISPYNGGLNGVLDYVGSNLKECYGPILVAVVLNALLTSFVAALAATLLF